MVIRDYRPEDFPQVIQLWKSTGIFREQRGDTRDAIDHCNRLGGKFLVMEDPDTGVLSGTSWMTFDGRRIHLHHFAIRPELQGKGLGHTLALESLHYARLKGYPVKLEVHRANHRAIRLYASLGFQVMQDYDVYMLLESGRVTPDEPI
jgi:ribosomal protein S18 acetylase RimI-like enzyme